jgi:hypothetical protein
MNDKLRKVVDILTSDSHTLRELADISGRDCFRFYNAADLTGLDLSAQNLTGMNFDGADLRFTNLTSVVYDPGCFNKSTLDKSQLWLRDEFEYSFDEIVNFPTTELLVFAKIRPSIVDNIVYTLGISFEAFAKRAGISTGPLRKARQANVVSIETAQKVLSTCRAFLTELGEKSLFKYGASLEQPCASLLVGGNNSPFRTLTHDELSRLLLIRELRLRENYKRYKGDPPEYLFQRDTAGYLRFFEHLMGGDNPHDRSET